MKKILFIILIPLYTYSNTIELNKALYQQHIQFYKEIYEREKVKTTTMKNQLDNQGLLKKLNYAKYIYFKNKNAFNNYLTYQNKIGKYNALVSKHGIAYSRYSRYKNSINYQKFKKLNLEQNLNDLADLIEDYTPNTTVEIDDKYNIYINDVLLE